jgi:hypothetical protein
VTGPTEQYRRARRTAWLLGALALAFYLGFYLTQLANSAG